jgi:predicted dinucleotide-binding enzyme
LQLTSWFEEQRNYSLESERTVRKKDEMKIAIIGMGTVGFTLGKKWVQAKHEVTFGSRPESIQKHRKKLLSENPQAKAESVRTAASDADVIVLAVPHTESLNRRFSKGH